MRKPWSLSLLGETGCSAPRSLTGEETFYTLRKPRKDQPLFHRPQGGDLAMLSLLVEALTSGFQSWVEGKSKVSLLRGLLHVAWTALQSRPSHGVDARWCPQEGKACTVAHSQSVGERSLPRRIFPHSAHRPRRNQEAASEPCGNHKTRGLQLGAGSCSAYHWGFLLAGILRKFRPVSRGSPDGPQWKSRKKNCS